MLITVYHKLFYHYQSFNTTINEYTNVINQIVYTLIIIHLTIIIFKIK